MTKFKHFALLLLAAITMFGCSNDYDDSGIKKDISDLQSRVEKLEKWCDTANGQITSLQGLVTALQGNDYVTGVTPVMEGTTEVGYTISFTKSKPITIMHGKNGTSGKDGSTPVIGVKKHDDGLYYWTIQTGSAEADWMKDADGNMIPTTGKDGAAGQKPVISIAKDGDRYYWQIDGKWLEDADGNKVPATGDKGDTGAAGSDGTNGTNGTNGDSFFKSVTPDTAKGTVVIKLANDTEFTLPMLSTTVSFDAYTPLQIATPGTETPVTVILSATLKKADFAAIKADITNVAGTNSTVTRAAAEKWAIALTAPTFKNDGTLDAQPKVKVTVPATATAGETALLEVTVVDTKGNKSTSTRVLFYDNTVAVTSVTLAPTTPTVNVGKTSTLTATILPAEATNKTVTWTSSNTEVATVADGVVTGVKAGDATITVTTEDGNFTATCAVKVEKIAVEKIELADATISIGGKKTLVPTFTPTDATIKTLTWSSNNTDVATVNATTGEVEGKTAGEATITATSTEYPSIKGTCKVTVTAAPPVIWATGNLVANGANGAKIGEPTDGGLYFQFGSLIGWAGGASGDGTGVPASNTPGYAYNASGTVVPSGKSIPTTWGDPNKWTGTTGTVPAANDPCTHYLGSDWRLPTLDEYKALFNNVTTPYAWADTGGWDWNVDSKSAIHTGGSKFPASGSRRNGDASMNNVGTYGYCWCASPNDVNNGYSLSFRSSLVDPSRSNNRSFGFPVRCVQSK